MPGEQVLQAYLPASWFAELEDPLEHEIIKRFVPDARARLRRRTGAVLPGVNFRDDAGLEQMGFRILLHGSVVAEGRLKPRSWYCPAHLTAALSSHARARLKSAPEAAAPTALPVLSSFPAPEDPDPLTVLVAWPPGRGGGAAGWSLPTTPGRPHNRRPGPANPPGHRGRWPDRGGLAPGQPRDDRRTATGAAGRAPPEIAERAWCAGQ